MKTTRMIPLLMAGLALGTASAGHVRMREPRLWSPARQPAGKLAGGTAAKARPGGTAAIEAVAALAARLGISAGAEAFAPRAAFTDPFGRTHVRLQQLHKGVEVDGRELIVHFDARGAVYEVNGDYLDGLSLDTTPAFAAEDATLVVFCRGDDAATARLAWKSRRGRSYIFTDAQTGEVFHVRRAAPHAQAAEYEEIEADDLPFDYDSLIRDAAQRPLPSGSPVTVAGNLPPQQGGGRVTVDATRGTDGRDYLAFARADGTEFAVLDGFAAPAFRRAAVQAYRTDDARWFRTFHTRAPFTAWSATGTADAENALAIACNISTVLDYYKAAFGRASYDGKGGRVAAWRFWNDDMDAIEDGYANAFWISMDEAPKRPGCFFFGYDLSGQRSETSLDTCGHELTHGITSWTANLQYEGEPGALNESFSDIIGVSCEFAAQPRAADVENPAPGEADWLFDEDSGDAARSLANPRLHNQPARYKGMRWVSTADTSDDNDYGGVHSNSGVQNFFYYLLCEGGKGSNEGIAYDLAGIGVAKAEQVAYLALTAYCGPRTDYAAVTGCWDSAALDLEESGLLAAEDRAAVSAAWAAVMSAPSVFDASGETLYAGRFTDEDGDAVPLLVRVGAASRRGIVRVAATLTVGGRSLKFTGKTTLDMRTVRMYNRRIGTLELFFAADAASASLTTDEDGETTDLSLPRVSPAIGAVSGLSDLRVGVAAAGSIGLDGAAATVRYSARKMPSGLKVATRTGEISGVPRKAADGTAVLSARCTFAVEGERRPAKATVAKSVGWHVAALDGFAQGRFAGEGVSLAISKAGRLSGSAAVGGRKVRLSAKSYASYAAGAYRATGTMRGGETFTVTVDTHGLVGVVTGEAGETAFSARKVR